MDYRNNIEDIRKQIAMAESNIEDYENDIEDLKDRLAKEEDRFESLNDLLQSLEQEQELKCVGACDRCGEFSFSAIREGNAIFCQRCADASVSFIEPADTLTGELFAFALGGEYGLSV